LACDACRRDFIQVIPMRDDTFLADVLKLHGRLAMTALVLVSLAIAGIVLVLLIAPPSSVVAARGLVIASIGCALALGLSRYGSMILRKGVHKAADERESVIALAHRDALTGAFTRSYFLSLLKDDVHHGSPRPVGYMQVDMDHLKALNDGHGHAAGDAALVNLIATIRRLAPGAIVGRLGGDEFGIALRDTADKQALCQLGAAILGELGQEMWIAGRLVRLSATVGVAVAPGDAADVDDLMSKADLALYKGKKTGRNMVVGYDQDMLVDERHNRFVERELRAAIILNELALFYQPVYRADGVTLKSYEALVRWHHTVRGTIPPSEFITIAEQSDMIDKLGEWVLRRVCTDLAELGTPTVALNVSPVQLRRDEFAARFKAIIDEAGVRGDRLVVEITENVLLQTGGVETSNLNALRAMGVRIAIDDFGAGHANLEYLRKFSFDIIKIDRSYVANLTTSKIDVMIVAAICEIARAIGVEVVGEGVETDAQMRVLQSCGCTSLQGYLLGRPAPLLQVQQAVVREIASAA
jgi:diguanylate cyclase (GGDEF)-like protein